MLTPFKCLKFVKCFAAFTTQLWLNILPNHTFSEKIPKNRFEDMTLTADRSYSMWNSLSKLEKE